jgi:hypothetical protein
LRSSSGRNPSRLIAQDAENKYGALGIFGGGEWELAMRLSLFIPGGFAVVVCIASPALAAHKGKPISAYQNGCVTRSSQGSGVHNCVPTPPCPGLPSCDPCSGITSTSADDFAPIKQMQLEKFDGTTFKLFGEVISGSGS